MPRGRPPKKKILSVWGDGFADMSEVNRLTSSWETFVGLLSKGQVAHWTEIAKICGVSRNTIDTWKKIPQAQAAMAEGASAALGKMETVGASDWRMWDRKLQLLGIGNKQEIDLTSGGESLVRNMSDEQLAEIIKNAQI